MTPLGIVIGMMMRHRGVYAEPIIKCLSAGSFLFMATNEVIVEEFKIKKNKNIKFLLFLVSIVSMTWIMSNLNVS